MIQRPLLVFTLCWVLGSGTACMYSGWELITIILGISIIIIAVLIRKQMGFIYTGCMLISLLVSSAYWEWNDVRNVSSLPILDNGSVNEDHVISVFAEGVLVSPVKVDGDRADFEFSIRSINDHKEVKEKVQVQVKLLTQEEKKKALRWKRGDNAEITGQLERPGTARNFDGFDYRQFLRSNEIHWIFKVKGISKVVVQEPEIWKLSHLFRWNDGVREYLGGRIDQLFSGVNAGYMKGLIIGDKDDLDPDTFAEFSRLGLTHILAISGMHVAVFVGSLLFIFKACRLTRETSLTAVIFLIPIYVLLTGASPSVVRAGVMGMIGFYAARRGLLKDGLHILSATAWMMLLWNPYFLLNVSFQLSFLVTAGLMLFVPKLMPFLSFVPRWLAGTVGVTLAAQFVSFPLTIYYFNQFSLVSFLANLLMVPLISLIVLPMGTIALIVGLVWLTGAKWIARITEGLNAFTFSSVEWMNSSPTFITLWPSPKLWWIVSYYIVLYMLLHIGNAKKKHAVHLISEQSDDTMPLSGAGHTQKRAVRQTKHHLSEWLRSLGLHRLANACGKFGSGTGVACLICLFILLLYSGYQGSGKQGFGWVQFLDVGQGDSILVSTPEGKHILIDAGGTTNFRKAKDAWKERSKPFEVGAKVVVPLLKKRGIHALDMVMITHNHQDHSGGLQAVLEEIPVKSIAFNGTLAKSKTFEQLLKTAVQQNIPVFHAKSGLVYQPDNNTEILFLNSDIKTKDQGILPIMDNQNHESLVFELRMNGARFLFTGDADEKAEQQILTDQADQIVKDETLRSLDVLKVGHHGSKTSTSEAWLKTWKPETSVISAGVNNMYNHPHPDVVERLQRYGSRTFRTDLQGEIQMRVSRSGIIDIRTKWSPDD